MYRCERVGQWTACGLILVIVLAFSGDVHAFPNPPIDTNKLHRSIQGYVLSYTDTDSDEHHDPGEPYVAAWPVGGMAWAEDSSCWMASAQNIVLYEGEPEAMYEEWLRLGGAHSPNTSPWGAENGCAAAGGGDRMTFDDPGWQHWTLAYCAYDFEYVKTTVQFDKAKWAVDPVDWCLNALDQTHAPPVTSGDHPVGLMIWGGDPAAHDEHAVTLWSITKNPTVPNTGTLVITDSDDGVDGPRTYAYTYAANTWKLTGPAASGGRGIYYVNYAVYVPSEPVSAAVETSWGRIKAMYR